MRRQALLAVSTSATLTLTLTLALAIAFPVSAATPPTTEQIAAIRDAGQKYLREAGKDATEADRAAYFATLTAEIDPAECSWPQLKQLLWALNLVPAKATAVQARLDLLAAEATADGFDAFMYRNARSQPGPTAKDLFGHPGYPTWKQAATPMARVRLLGQIPPDQYADAAAELAELQAWFSADRSAKDLGAGIALVEALREISPDTNAGETFRVALLGYVKAAGEKASAEDKAAYTKLAKRLDNAITRGEFMDHTAPPLTFTWAQDANGPVSVASLDDLKGKVVVLDFWATWCGPCVGSIPNVRELRAHYSPDDVIIVGVTSVQGKHYPGGGAAPVDCTNDAAKEQALMAEFMKGKQIDWIIAFSEQEVFNPDYGVNGIPHVTILDADGIVRHNNLHPADALSEKCAKIDALLTKQGKKPPPAPKAPEADAADGAAAAPKAG